MIDTQVYNTILEKFRIPSVKDYMDIIEFCNACLDKANDDADAYYIKSMALFGLATRIKDHDEIYALINSEEVKYSNLRSGYMIKKIQNNIKLADKAVEVFNKAYNLDNKIIEKHPYLRVIVEYELTGTRYFFSKPISAKEIDELIFQNKKWTLVGIMGILAVVATGITGFLAGELLAVKVLLSSVAIVMLAIWFYPNKNTRILNKYKDFITEGNI